MPIFDSNVSDKHNLYGNILAQIFNETAPQGVRANSIYADKAYFTTLDVTGADGTQKHTFVKFSADLYSYDVDAAVDDAIHALGTYGIVASKGEDAQKDLPMLVIDLDQDNFAEKLTAFQESFKDVLLKGARETQYGSTTSQRLELMPRKPNGDALDPELAATLVTQTFRELKDTADSLGNTTREALKKAVGEGRQRSML